MCLSSYAFIRHRQALNNGPPRDDGIPSNACPVSSKRQEAIKSQGPIIILYQAPPHIEGTRLSATIRAGCVHVLFRGCRQRARSLQGRVFKGQVCCWGRRSEEQQTISSEQHGTTFSLTSSSAIPFNLTGQEELSPGARPRRWCDTLPRPLLTLEKIILGPCHSRFCFPERFNGHRTRPPNVLPFEKLREYLLITKHAEKSFGMDRV